MRTVPTLYERLTWPEVREATGENLVCLIPVATLEDHGPHLPIDTDLRLTAEICRRAAESAAGGGFPAADSARLFPASHGLSRPDHDRVGHVHALPDRRGHVAGASRLQAHALPERARIEPELRRGGGKT